jgi:hypothetical protein
MQIKLPDFEAHINQEILNAVPDTQHRHDPLRTAIFAARRDARNVMVGTIHVWIYTDGDGSARYTIEPSLIEWYEVFLTSMALPITVVFSDHRCWVKEE